MGRGVVHRVGGVALVGALITSTWSIVAPMPDEAHAAGGSVAGRVFHDYNLDGERQEEPADSFTEVGVENVVVKAYDSSGAQVGSTTTAADGTYTLTIINAATNDIRVEFDTPTGYEPSFVGVDVGPRVQFTTLGATDVTYAVQVPHEFCQANPSVFSTCFYPGNLTYSASLGSLRSTTWTGRTTPQTRLQVQSTGSIWGVAVQRTTGLVFASAGIRRHTALGPKGLGGLYVTTASGTSVLASFDLTASPYNLILSAGTDYSDTARGITNTELSVDVQGFNGVGTEGIGDIDISPNGEYLFLTNMHRKSVVRIELTGTAASPQLGTITEFAVPASLCTETERPWALKTMPDGTVLVGVACSDLRTYSLGVSPADKVEVPERAVVARLDPEGTGTWSTETTVSLDHPRRTDFCTGAKDTSVTTDPACVAARWHPWTNDWTKINVTGVADSMSHATIRVWPQPILTDIDVLDDGSLVVGMSDRLSLQLGSSNYQPTNTSDSLVYTWVHGDMLLVCKTAGGYVQESNGDCGTDYTSSGRLEFFNDTHIHAEPIQGGLAVHPSRIEDTVVASIMDPIDIFESGLMWFDEGTGEKSGTGVAFIPRDDPGATTFQKASAMGDVEVLCDYAPLQIGDRLWFDSDGDGVQDAGEPPVVGVTVNLRDSTGAIVDTVLTDADGHYRFSSLTAGGLVTGESFTITVDNPADFGVGGVLNGWRLTRQGRGTGTDSDATLVDGYPSASVVPLAAGENDHTYDFGFTNLSVPPEQDVSVGGVVWNDLDADGVQDSGEPPLRGVRLRLWTTANEPVVDLDGVVVAPVTSDESGRYLFTRLRPGEYIVTATTPDGMTATVGTSKTSHPRVVSGQSDLGMHFGFATPQSTTVVERLPDTGADPWTILAATFFAAMGVVTLTASRRRRTP